MSHSYAKVYYSPASTWWLTLGTQWGECTTTKLFTDSITLVGLTCWDWVSH